MTQLLIIREYIKTFISRNETYLRPAGKFILSMISLILINSKIGYASKLTNFAFTVILSLVCSFLPANFIVLLCAGMMLLHLYALSLESVIVVGVLLVLMFLLYFRFSPKDTLFLLLTPICFVLKIPYVIPISAGLVSGVSSAVSVGSGIAIYYILTFINTNKDALTGMASDEMVAKLRFLIDELLFNKEMLMFIIGFAVTIVVVNIVRRLSVDYAWTIAIVIGTLSNIVVVLAGDLKFGTYISVLGLIGGSIVAAIVVTVIKFFAFNVDYSKTEKVQFEDDDYYYYVKAVPKNKAPRMARNHRKQTSSQVESENRQERRTRDSENNRNNINNGHKSATKSSHSGVVSGSSTGTTKKNATTSNKNINKRIIQADEELYDGQIVRRRRTDSSGLTDIERAAAAKARASRKNSNNN